MIKKQLVNTKHFTEFLFLHGFNKIKNWLEFLSLYTWNKHRTIIILKNNTKLSVRANSTDQWTIHEIVIRDDYKIQELNLNKKTIIDIGANVGIFTTYCAAKWKDAKIYAYEPIQENVSAINKNLLLNGITKNVSVINAAVSDDLNGVEINIDNANNGGHSLLINKGTTKRKIKSVTLEEIFKQHNISKCDLIKMDVEGSEYQILYSTKKNIFNKIKRINLEFHNIDKQHNNGLSLKTFLEKMNFSVIKVDSSFSDHGYLYCKSKLTK